MDDIPTESIAQSLCSSQREGFFKNAFRHIGGRNSYEQGGNFKGSLTVDGQEEREIYLWGPKIRVLENLQFCLRKEKHYLGFMKSGTIFHVENDVKGKDDSIFTCPIGCVMKASGLINPIIRSNAHSFGTHLRKRGSVLCIETETENLLLTAKCTGGLPPVTAEDTESGVTVEALSLTNDEETGKGLYITIHRSVPPTPDRIKKVLNVVSPKLSQSVKRNQLMVTFQDPRCQDSSLTGGKGSSLAVLTSISKNLKTFSVPKGIVLTTEAYKLFEKVGFLKDIETMEKISRGIVEGDLRKECESLVLKIGELSLPEPLLQALKQKLDEVFEAGLTEVAVRSSAIGEDSEEMSAAGQMATFLGVKGFDHITSAIVKCWASQFSYTAVQYKRRFGQPLNSPMAVIVQEMVPAEKAGVLFTCDPLTGNTSKIVITSNFGLGESVVAAAADPDTLILTRGLNHEVKLTTVDIGSKKIKIRSSETGGTVTEEITEGSKISSLTIDEALSLGRVGDQVEEFYGNSRDIEWAVSNGEIYLLQSRPVTSIDKETEFELTHMLDSGIATEYECLTKANIGEGMPGAMTPLGMMVVSKHVNNQGMKYASKKQGLRSDINPYTESFIVSSHQQFFINLSKGFVGLTKDSSIAERSITYSLLGRSYENPELAKMLAKRTSKPSNFIKNQELLLTILHPIFASRQLKSLNRHYENQRIDLCRCKTSLEMLDVIANSSIQLFHDSMISLVNNSSTSSLFNMLILLSLAYSEGDLNTDVFSDFSKCVTTTANDVESADVPQSIQTLAKIISASKKGKEFPELNIKDALKWLINDKEKPGQTYKKFLEKHGHRCIKEFDIHSKPWGTNPEPLIKTLQTIVKTLSSVDSTQKNKEFTLDDLKIKLPWKSRLVLKLIMPISRKAVAWRECAKSIAIRTVNIFRVAVNELATKLVQEGRIPDPDLAFYFSFDELHRFIMTGSPQLCNRAYQRRRMHDQLNKLKFPVISKGVPKPIQRKVDGGSHPSVYTLKGTPVSQGSVKARARVVIDLEDAPTIKKGEILITCGTDTGWTPYFPLLSGVVTELGGLLSHGAVVSREYGLPCVAALENVTSIVKTGDYILVDGTKGTVEKLKEEPDVEE